MVHGRVEARHCILDPSALGANAPRRRGEQHALLERDQRLTGAAERSTDRPAQSTVDLGRARAGGPDFPARIAQTGTQPLNHPPARVQMAA